jgi:hypothetical protein
MEYPNDQIIHFLPIRILIHLTIHRLIKFQVQFLVNF